MVALATREGPVLIEAGAARARVLMARWRGERPLFCCVLAHTDTCLLPGVSAAGATEALRPYTPAADAEAIWYGAPRCLPGLPSNPEGPPGPAAITRAALRLAGLRSELVGIGLRIWPDGPCRKVDAQPGGSVQLGAAVPEARRLFHEGFAYGADLARRTPYLVLGESVPGGTTTALALLLALGIRADGRVSGSSPGNAHALKARLAHAGLAAAGISIGDGQADPLRASAAVGDPMQPFAAGVLVGAAQHRCPVLLAGGSQMLAVAALARAATGADVLRDVAVGTTRWVSRDPAADVRGLACEVDPGLPLLAIDLNFRTSRHPALWDYEAFLVKEGVGAGGACIAAHLATGASQGDLQAAIDAAYDPLLSP